ncbi:MAG: hypothetical protein AAFZ65_01975 [Planctomycetota bacterium]
MYRKSTGALAALALLGLTSNASAQLLGDWEDSTFQTVEVYVSPTGLDVFPNGTLNDGLNPSCPLQTLQAVESAYGPIFGLAAFTINLAPGIYAPPTDGSFTITAFGTSVETWNNGSGGGPLQRAVLDAQGGIAIEVTSIGQPTLPPSVIDGLEFMSAGSAVNIDTGAAPAGQDITLAVEIRDNLMEDCFNGVSWFTDASLKERHVIENNIIGDDTLRQAAGLFAIHNGLSSTLIRSNVVSGFEEGITILNSNSASPDRVRPRVFSNFVRLGERLVNLFDTDAVVINNTVAFAYDFTVVPSVSGIDWRGGTLELHNNILWNPLTPSGTTANDLLTAGTVNQTSNLNEDVALNTPGFAGGDAHPASTLTDLHLSSTSAMIGAGNLAEVAAVPGTVRSIATGSMRTRIDLAVDVDLDSRVHRALGEPSIAVDIGADEFHAVSENGRDYERIDLVNPAGVTPATQDALGNLSPLPPLPGQLGNQRRYEATLYLTGQPGALWFINYGIGYLDTVLDPAVGLQVQNRYVFQNTFALGISGNLQLDLVTPLGGASTLFGVFDPMGDATAVFPFGTVNVAPPTSLLEAESWLQMVSVDAAGLVRNSNRVTVELNDRQSLCPVSN